MTVYPPHSAERREVLRKAGLSEQSELTYDEDTRLSNAVRAHREDPSLSRDQLYRVIRPRRDDE